jgi:hypothetical protein
MTDEFAEYYSYFLDGVYDCVDRIVLNAYFPLAQSGGGFRTFWRNLRGGDDDLNNTNLMRFAGRFSRRVRAWAKKNGIPLIDCTRGERKHKIAERYIPADSAFRGVFCILIGRAPGSIWDVQRYGNGGINLEKKKSRPYVNHYSFHIMDPFWGHIIIKLCPHPPFNAQIILNGHEYVARQAKKKGVDFTKEANCFTELSDAAGLGIVADTMRSSGSVGRLIRVCERWIYSASLFFALTVEEQQKTGFRYAYSVYQAEYSRNFLFKRGRVLDQVFHGIIDRTRAPLQINRLKTIFGYKRRPYKKKDKEKEPRFEVVLERPVYDLTVFKVHLGKLTVKMYSKGERVLRIEAIAHNTKDLRCGKMIEKFPQITAALRRMVEHFLSVLRYVDVSFIDDGLLESMPSPSYLGNTRVAGIDINKPRMRAVMEAVISLSVGHKGFSVSEVVGKVSNILRNDQLSYCSRQASYDLKKLRAKGFLAKVDASRNYRTTSEGLRSMVALFVILDKVIKPLLSGIGKRKTGRKRKIHVSIDEQYKRLQKEMQNLLEALRIAA